MKIKYIFPVLALMLSTACSEQGDEFPFRQGKLPNDIVQENGQNPPLGDKGDSFDKKYGIKSGTIYFESWFKFEDKFSEGTSVVYFDDYGLKERNEGYGSDGSLSAIQFTDGSNLYYLSPKDKSAYVHKSTYPGTEPRVSWADVPASQKASGWAKKGANQYVLDKNCEVYYITIDGGHEKYAGWNNICLLYEMIGSGYGDYSKVAVRIVEGPVDADLFILPGDYSVRTD